MATTVSVSGVDLDVVDRGKGTPLLFLHAGEGLGAERPWLELLARRHRVIAPSHPGFGGSRLPDWMGSVDDLAYLYLDLAQKLELRDAILVGASFGGWVAAEMLVRSTARFSKVVLAAPLGIKASPREVSDIAHMHSMSRAEFLAAAFADPKVGEVDTSRLTESELRGLVSGREALCLYGWRPYMHNPRLKPWLHRIDKPTLLVWGGRDRILSPGYKAAWEAALPQVRATTLKDAGHFPHWEQPEAFAAAVETFATG